MQWTRLFSAKGRLAPGAYWKVMAASFALSTLGAWWLSAVVMGAAVELLRGQQLSLVELGLTLSVAGSMVVVFSWVLYNAVIKRLHDAGQSGWWTLLMVVPSGSLVVPLVAGVLPSVQGRTAYDEPERIKL
jgi:uncharacterized membrane protein YhaH (DUF805 family)